VTWSSLPSAPPPGQHSRPRPAPGSPPPQAPERAGAWPARPPTPPRSARCGPARQPRPRPQSRRSPPRSRGVLGVSAARGVRGPCKAPQAGALVRLGTVPNPVVCTGACAPSRRQAGWRPSRQGSCPSQSPRVWSRRGLHAQRQPQHILSWARCAQLSQACSTYRDIVPDSRGRLLALRVVPRHVHHRPVLNIAVCADVDGVHVTCAGHTARVHAATTHHGGPELSGRHARTAQHRSVPYGGPLPQCDVAYDACIRCHKRAGCQSWPPAVVLLQRLVPNHCASTLSSGNSTPCAAQYARRDVG